MAVADEHVAVRRDDDVGRAVEVRRPVAGVRGRAEPQQLAAVRRELDDLMAAVVAAARVGDPDVAAGIDVDAVRPREQARAERAEPLAVGADVQDRIEVAVAKQSFAPQRSAIHSVPSGATSTMLIEPSVRPSGAAIQPRDGAIGVRQRGLAGCKQQAELRA